MNIQPTLCLRPHPDKVAQFVAPPYDTVSDDEARAFVRDHPNNFMEIDLPQTSFPEGVDPTDPQVYERAHELLLDRQRDFTLLRDEKPCYYLYELSDQGHSQTGLVAACAVSDYRDGTIRRHEKTRVQKEQDRFDHIKATRAQTSPALIAYPDNYAVDVIVGAAKMAEPLYDFTFEDGVRHRVWRIAREAAQDALTATFATIPAGYIADGHHRAAAAVRYAREWHEAHPSTSTPQSCDYFLAVLFPANQLRTLAYNRAVTNLNGISPEEFERAVEQAGFKVGVAQSEPFVPEARGSMGMYLDGFWHELSWEAEASTSSGQGAAGDSASGRRISSNPAALLDVSILQERVLGPILGVDDPREDPRMRFLPASAPASELQDAAGRDGVAFWMYPTSMEELMAVADAGELMPPKSTWFSPKLLSGLFVRRLDWRRANGSKAAASA